MKVNIQQLLEDAIGVLNTMGSGDSAALDAEILLAHVLQSSRASVLAYPERVVSKQQQSQFETLNARRAQGEPVAYLVGHKEFWSLDLTVNPSVLIPRPDTELLVQCCLEKCDSGTRIIADLGTGSGAIALALATELPGCDVIATDASAEAVTVARINTRAAKLSNVEIRRSDWFGSLEGERFDLIAANPPYVDPLDPHLCGEVRYEPREALVSEDHGLADLGIIIPHAPSYLLDRGWLLVEHGFDQADSVRGLFRAAGFKAVCTYRDLSGNERVTEGQWNQR